MKRITVLSFVLAVMLAFSGTALADVISQWNFNQSYGANPNVGTGTVAAIAGSTLTYNSIPAGGGNPYSSDTTGGGTNYAMKVAWGSPVTGSGAEWSFSTVGIDLSNVTLAMVRSASGSQSPLSYTWGYYDGTWHDTTFTLTSNTSWQQKNFTFGAGADNYAGFKFHILANDTRTTYTYIDLVTFNGTTAVPIPAAAWLLGSGLIGLVAIRRRMKK
jgi:hypothetical protein